MRIDDYDWKKLPPDLVEWLNDVTDLLNRGGYAISFSDIPTSSTVANTGENRIAKDGATWYLYVYTDSDDGWKKIAMSDL